MDIPPQQLRADLADFGGILRLDYKHDPPTILHDLVAKPVECCFVSTQAIATGGVGRGTLEIVDHRLNWLSEVDSKLEVQQGLGGKVLESYLVVFGSVGVRGVLGRLKVKPIGRGWGRRGRLDFVGSIGRTGRVCEFVSLLRRFQVFLMEREHLVEGIGECADSDGDCKEHHEHGNDWVVLCSVSPSIDSALLHVLSRRTCP